MHKLDPKFRKKLIDVGFKTPSVYLYPSWNSYEFLVGNGGLIDPSSAWVGVRYGCNMHSSNFDPWKLKYSIIFPQTAKNFADRRRSDLFYLNKGLKGKANSFTKGHTYNSILLGTL